MATHASPERGPPHGISAASIARARTERSRNVLDRTRRRKGIFFDANSIALILVGVLVLVVAVGVRRVADPVPV